MAAAELLRRRLGAQLLAGPPVSQAGHEGAVAVARRLLAIQAQDPLGARLAIRARSAAVIGADVDAALTDHRSLVLTWLNRGTLHLVAVEDYPLLQAGNRARRARPGAEETARVAAGRGRALAQLARRYLAGHGPAQDRDLARWSGLPLRDARAGLTAIASELHERPDGLVQLAAAADRALRRESAEVASFLGR